MVSLLRKLIPDDDDRRLFGAMVVVAANAGGVWTPIGDVTTTMLWINNQLSTVPTILELFLPSFVCLVASLAFLVRQVRRDEIQSRCRKSLLCHLDNWSLVKCMLLAVPAFAEFTVSATV
jgi:Na+/H+ antiporter NhaD/arsenite permease-like protein